MVDLSGISSALSSIKLAGDIAKTMIGLRDAQAFNAKMIEFQSAIIDAQNSALAANEERAALVDRIRKLEKEVADFKAWEAQKQRYNLKNLGYGAIAYMLKPAERGTEPPHWVCAHCFQKGQIYILQFTIHGATRNNARRGWFCPSCHKFLDLAFRYRRARKVRSEQLREVKALRVKAHRCIYPLS